MNEDLIKVNQLIIYFAPKEFISVFTSDNKVISRSKACFIQWATFTNYKVLLMGANISFALLITLEIK